MKEKTGIFTLIFVIAISVGIFFMVLISMKGGDIGVAHIMILGFLFILAIAAFFSIQAPGMRIPPVTMIPQRK